MGPNKTTAKKLGFLPFYVSSLRRAGIPQFAERLAYFAMYVEKHLEIQGGFPDFFLFKK
jgi:hypothetical protein